MQLLARAFLYKYYIAIHTPRTMNHIKQIFCAILCCAFVCSQGQGIRSVNNIGFDEVSIIELAGNGDIWVGSASQGVGFYNNATQQWAFFNTTNTPELKSNTITAIAIQVIGGVEHAFIGTPNGVALNRITTGWDTLAITGSKDIKGLIYKPDSLMVFSDEGLMMYDSNATHVANFSSPSPTAITTAQIRAAGCGGYWAGTLGSGCFSTADGVNYNFIDTSVMYQKLVDNRINVISRDNMCGARLVGTKGGFSRCPVNPGIPCENFTTAQGLPQNDITAIAEDCLGRLWLGTRDSGMVVYENEGFTRLTTAQGLPDNRITSVGIMPQTCEFYIGMKDGNIAVVDSTKSVTEILSTIGKVNLNDIGVNIYPVPANDKLHFVFDQQLNADFRLMDVNGREVYSSNMSNSLFVKVDVSTLPQGMYFYRLESEGKTLKAGKVSVVK